VFRKVGRVATPFILPPAAVVLLLAWVARPLVLIRFGSLPSTRLGPFAGTTELYLCNRDASTPKRRTWDIFFCNAPACNQQLKRMWVRTILISPWAKWPYLLAKKFCTTHMFPQYNDRDVEGLLACTPPHLSFTAEEEQLGQAALRELGIPQGAAFICFLARDIAFMDASFPYRKWDDNDYRNSSIHSQLPMAEELTRRGYFALRMGAIVKEALNTTNPMILDYATKHRTDFLDIYLGAACGPLSPACPCELLERRPEPHGR